MTFCVWRKIIIAISCCDQYTCTLERGTYLLEDADVVVKLH